MSKNLTFSKLDLPLRQLTRKGRSFVCDTKCEESFERVEEAVDFSANFDFVESKGIVCCVL